MIILSKSSRNATKEKLYKLRLALEYAKKEKDNELKVMKIEEDIKQVRDKIKQEAFENARKGR